MKFTWARVCRFFSNFFPFEIISSFVIPLLNRCHVYAAHAKNWTQNQFIFYYFIRNYKVFFPSISFKSNKSFDYGSLCVHSQKKIVFVVCSFIQWRRNMCQLSNNIKLKLNFDSVFLAIAFGALHFIFDFIIGFFPIAWILSRILSRIQQRYSFYLNNTPLIEREFHIFRAMQLSSIDSVTLIFYLFYINYMTHALFFSLLHSTQSN